MMKSLLFSFSEKLTLVQFSLSVVSDSATPWTTARQASLSITNFQSFPKLMSIELVMPSNHLILCHPLLLLPSIFPNIRVFSHESALRMRWPKYWSFSFNISPSNEHPGLISFRMDWLDLLAVHGTHKTLLQHHSLKALCCSSWGRKESDTIEQLNWTELKHKYHIKWFNIKYTPIKTETRQGPLLSLKIVVCKSERND